MWRLRNLYSDFIVIKDGEYYILEMKQVLKRQNIYTAITELLSAEKALVIFVDNKTFPMFTIFKKAIVCKGECCLSNATYIKTLNLWNIEVIKIPKVKKVKKETVK